MTSPCVGSTINIRTSGYIACYDEKPSKRGLTALLGFFHCLLNYKISSLWILFESLYLNSKGFPRGSRILGKGGSVR